MSVKSKNNFARALPPLEEACCYARFTIGLFFRLWTRQCNCRVLLERAGATPRTFWAAESRKSGVAPARFSSFFAGPFRVPKSVSYPD